MTTTLIISNIATWIALIALGITVLALVRQVGLLHERISPAGALSIDKKNLTYGEPAPSFQLPSLTGGEVRLGGDFPHPQSTLLFFLSDTCPVCKTLLPSLQAIAKEESSWLRLVLASDGEHHDHESFINKAKLSQYPYLLSTELGMAYEVGKLPYGVLLDEQGNLVSHGLVNTREHLDSLLEAKRLNTPTVQTYVANQTA